VVKYCDGTSFTSNRLLPATFNGTRLWFRGRPILQAVLKDIQSLGFGQATAVLLSGCSAGGLSTFHAADWIYSQLPSSVKKYGALPVSGYFLLHNNVGNTPVYPSEMQTIYYLGNCSYGISSACQQAMGANAWQCIFAQNVYPYIKSPIFISNSMFDSWQIICILTSEPDHSLTGDGNCSSAAGWQNCPFGSQQCQASQWGVLNSYAGSFISTLNSTANAHRAGNGGFIDSCLNHCEAVYSYSWNGYKIGGVSMNQAASNWWTSLGSSSSQNNWFWDCNTYSATAPHVCNPTCG